jgi:uncharacterized membrane protein/YHS domain-containing protein
MDWRRLHVMTHRVIGHIVSIVVVGILLAVAPAPARAGEEPLPPGANKMCPVMQDQPTKASRFVDQDGRRIYFCCDKCVARFKREPAKYLAVLDGRAPTESASVATAQPSSPTVMPNAPSTAPTGEASSPTKQFSSAPWQLFGRLHVVVVHFPIALILLAGLIELPRIGKRNISDTAYRCLMLGALATAVAAAMGWVNASNAFVGPSPRTLVLHRWSGVALAIAACVIAAMASVLRQKAVPTNLLIRATRWGTAACAALVAVVGHLGGTLTYGDDYFTSIFKTAGAPKVTLATATVAKTQAMSQTAAQASTRPTTAPADPLQVFVFGTAEEARMARINLRLASVPPAPAPPDVDGAASNEIDRFILAKWRDAKLPEYQNPPSLCDDVTFVRRVYLDLVGVIPTIEQARNFVADQSPDKRAKLVDELLDRDQDYAANWTPFFEEALASNPVQASLGLHGDYQPWIIASMKENRPYDVMFAQLVDPTEPGYQKKPARSVNGRMTQSAYVKNESHTDTLQSAANVGQFFLGTGMKCASCHSHFLNDEWPQQRFLGFAGLFGEKNLELIRCEKKSDVFVQAAYALPVPGAPTDVPTTVEQRLHYVTRLTVDPANPRFAKTAVNRLWRRYLGLGLFEPIDDFRLDSPAANPELLEWLARDFVEHGYDLKHTIRLILNSRTYQLKYDPRLEDHFDVAKRDTPRYWRSPSLRKLTAEQAMDSIRVAAAQKLDDRMRVYHTTQSTELTRTLGRPASRVEISTARADDVAIVQALELLNGPEWYSLIYRSRLVSDLAAEKEPAKLIDRAYRAVLSRPPTDDERELAVEFVKQAPPATQPATAPAAENVVWLDDELPNGATPGGSKGPESWTFARSPEPVFSGERSHVMSADPERNVQHLFIGVLPPVEIKSGDDVLYSYAYLDVKKPPQEIMLQFNAGDWEHRAYWGADQIPFGAANSPARMNAGTLPKPGEWVRLEVKASDVGLKPGDAVVGVSYDQHGGKAYWDKTGFELKPTPEVPGVGDLLWALFTSPEFQYVR